MNQYVEVKVTVETDDVLDELSSDEIIEYLSEDRGIDVPEAIVERNNSRRLPPQNLREKLCDMFDLAAMSPKEEILDYIKSAI
jgi:hypothetical protein